jgi:tetratricopeptide (TPR) repeat protein
MLAILAGGWLGSDRKPWPALAAVLLPLGFLSLTTFGNVNDKATFVEDYILMSRAALEVGWDDQAETYAGRAIELAPNRDAPREILALAQFNLMLSGLPALPGREELERRHDECVALQAFTDKMPYVAGVYAWLLGNPDEAVGTWQRLVDANSKDAEQALGALLMAGRLRPEDRDRIAQKSDAETGHMLLLARAATGDEAVNAALLARMTQEQRDAQVRAMQQLFLQRSPTNSAGR